MRRSTITTITRLRLDAALDEPAPPRPPGTIGRPRTKGVRLPTLSEVLTSESTLWQTVHVPGWYGAGERTIELTSATAVGGTRPAGGADPLGADPRSPAPLRPAARLCTDLAREAAQIVAWFVRRCEVTFQEVRAYLGVETTAMVRQGRRPHHALLLALFSIVPARGAAPGPPAAAGHGDGVVPKPQPTFSDVLAAVRRAIWREQGLLTSPRRGDRTKRCLALPEPWAYTLCQPPERPKSSQTGNQAGLGNVNHDNCRRKTGAPTRNGPDPRGDRSPPLPDLRVDERLPCSSCARGATERFP